MDNHNIEITQFNVKDIDYIGIVGIEHMYWGIYK